MRQRVVNKPRVAELYQRKMQAQQTRKRHSRLPQVSEPILPEHQVLFIKTQIPLELEKMTRR